MPALCHKSLDMRHFYVSIAFLDFMQWPHDPNFTVNVLSQVR